jgi:hypothetical protein
MERNFLLSKVSGFAFCDYPITFETCKTFDDEEKPFSIKINKIYT